MKRIYTPVKKKTVLIVDDDRVAVHIYAEKFQRRGFKTEVANNADSAMQKLKEDPVDLLILDLCMPGMDGEGTLKNIRSAFDAQALPVIVFSNPYLGNLERAALDAGATKSVTKADSTPDYMVELVRELLAGHARADGGTSEVAVSKVGNTLALESEAESKEKLAATVLSNASEILARLRTGHQIFAKAEEEESRRAELSEMHRQLRSLAGAAGLLGFQEIAQMTTALEALFIELRAKPKKITPSVVRTVAQAVDILASLFDRAKNAQVETVAPAKILVVDDEIISRETICFALGKAGLHAESLDDPLAAQHLLEQNHFDLIFLDVEMPGQTGLELCVKIREMALNRATPIVFVTSHSDFGSRAQSTLSGGNDFIAKPFLSVELAVKTLIWLFKESAPPHSAATAQHTVPAETVSHESPPLLVSHPAGVIEESTSGIDAPSHQ
jgi:CheY-like chemotaxis protein